MLQDDGEEERELKQFQFANWSDHDCPNPSSVLEYRRRIKAYMRNKPGPIVVHCGSVCVRASEVCVRVECRCVRASK